MAHEELGEEDPLQAVVLCDVFTQRFAPLTLDMPPTRRSMSERWASSWR